MKTTMTISTISYNTEAYLRHTLEQLEKAHVIAFWSYVEHLPEEDEKKKHFHVYLEPAVSIQTEALRDQFLEIVNGEELPRKVMPFNKSKFADWYLYGIHDTDYLSSKGQERKYHYTRNDVVCPDTDYLDEKIRQIDMLNLTPYAKMREAIEHGSSFDEILASGNIPITFINQYKQAWLALTSMYEKRKETNGGYTERNGREGHEKVEIKLSDGRLLRMDTGEVVEDWKNTDDLDYSPFEDE